MKDNIFNQLRVVQIFSNIISDMDILGIDFSINMMLGETPIFKTPYRMSMLELKELQLKLEELLKKGYICPSVSPWGAPVMFVKKKDGTLRLCIDFK
jgi:hypothetical protein